MTETARPWLDHYPAGVDWHATVPEAPLHTLLTNTAATFGQRPAYNFFGRRTSWAAACSQAERFAAGLQRLGLVPGDRVGLLLPNCPAYPTAFFGALMAGLVVVNFNPLYAQRELDHQARDAGIAALVTLDLAVLLPKAEALLDAGLVGGLIICPFASMLPPAKRILFRALKKADVAAVPVDDHHVTWAAMQASGTPAPVSCEPRTTMAVLQYTGGTSGTPKGAMLSHANLYANTMQGSMWFNRARPGQEVMLAAIPFPVLSCVRHDDGAAVFGRDRGRDRNAAAVRAEERCPHHRPPPSDFHAGRADHVQRHRQLPRPRQPEQHPVLHQRRCALAGRGQGPVRGTDGLRGGGGLWPDGNQPVCDQQSAGRAEQAGHRPAVAANRRRVA